MSYNIIHIKRPADRTQMLSLNRLGTASVPKLKIWNREVASIESATYSEQKLGASIGLPPIAEFRTNHYRLFCDAAKPDTWTGEALTDAAHLMAGGGLCRD
jgi:hypothetical protein